MRKSPQHADAGVAVENVDAAEGVERCLGESLAVGEVRDVTLDAHGLVPLRAQRLRGGENALAACREYHLSAVAREDPSDSLADALRGAGDDGDLAIELAHVRLQSVAGFVLATLPLRTRVVKPRCRRRCRRFFLAQSFVIRDYQRFRGLKRWKSRTGFRQYAITNV